MLSQKIYVVTAHENYMVGVQARTLYNKLHEHAGGHPRVISVKRSTHDNVAHEVNFGLKKFNIDTDYSKITVDTHASIEFYKEPIAPSVPITPNTVPLDDFLFYPFKNYMGIILPYQILYETDQSIVLQANIIDPVEDYRTFLKQL